MSAPRQLDGRRLAAIVVIAMLAAFVFARLTRTDSDAPRAAQRARSASPAAASPAAIVPGPPAAEDAQEAEVAQKEAAEATAPPRPGPGAVPDADPAVAPVVPRGQDLRTYVSAYYEAVKRGDWARAFAMVPGSGPAASLQEFRELQAAYALESFDIVSAVMDGSSGEAVVVHVTPDDGVWNTTWRFVTTSRGLVVRDLVYARPGGAGCH